MHDERDLGALAFPDQECGFGAFGSQLLCEQVVGRGLRRLDYTPNSAMGLLTEKYVDVYGIPFMFALSPSARLWRCDSR